MTPIDIVVQIYNQQYCDYDIVWCTRCGKLQAVWCNDDMNLISKVNVKILYKYFI